MAQSAYFPTLLRDGWIDPEELAAADTDKLWRYGALLKTAQARGIHLQLRPLRSLEGAWLVQGCLDDPAAGFGFALWTSRGFTELDGTAVPVYEVCDDADADFDSDKVLEYATLFSRFVYGDMGPFWLLRRVDDLNATTQPGGQAGEEPPAPPVAYDGITDEQLDRLIEAPEVTATDDGWRIDACVQYGSVVSRARFQLAPDGAMSMVDDEPLVTGLTPLEERNRPPRSLRLGSRQATRLEPLVPDATRPSDAEASTQPARRALRFFLDAPSGSQNERSRGRSILWECLRLQMLQSLRRGDAAPLFTAAPGVSDEDLLGEFANFLRRSWSALVLETPYHGAERTVATMLVELMDRKPDSWLTQDAVVGEPDLIGIPPVEEGDLLALSFHGARKMVRPEAAAFHLGATENLTFIACHSLSDLPPALQRMADIVLPLGAPGTELFRELFGRVFDCEWPAARAEDAMWLRYVEPQDLERPLRDRADLGEQWRPEIAVDAIRERVERRLTTLAAVDAPALEDLHGMDTAKAVIRDLIEDFRGAVAGELDWDQVDRGLLLVGEPGTGKTLLARAAARAAGVHFISTSAGRWAADATEFYDVIRAIRDVFDEAERYAPSILFIDELDSLGRRDQMVDRNRQLEMEELNTVLQELQGFRDRQGVFVIAATNHLDRIDPALTRAGRLDQVVRVSRPTKAALASILAYHLAPFVEQGRVAEGLDLDQLAAVAVGCTGADIEAFVRDAARRARKDGTPIDSEHLAAAITRAPRRGHGARPLSLVEQERVAFHEAGHALAGLLAREYPAELTIVSIIPRSDGSLGFAGFHGERHPGLTRAGHHEYLEILLAGRAAEEIRYGPDGVSSGAGGESATSDLALATRHAIRLITALGLHDDRSLRWRGADDRRADIALIDDLLDHAYEQVRARLEAHRPLLEAIAARLIADSEVLPDVLVSLARKHEVALPIRKPEASAR